MSKTHSRCSTSRQKNARSRHSPHRVFRKSRNTVGQVSAGSHSSLKTISRSASSSRPSYSGLRSRHPSYASILYALPRMSRNRKSHRGRRIRRRLRKHRSSSTGQTRNCIRHIKQCRSSYRTTSSRDCSCRSGTHWHLPNSGCSLGWYKKNVRHCMSGPSSSCHISQQHGPGSKSASGC